MGTPFDDLQNYHPGNGCMPFSSITVSDVAQSSGALTAADYYQVIADVDCYIKLTAAGGTNAAATGEGEYLPKDMWSLPFPARNSTDVVTVLRVGDTSGTLWGRRVGRR